MHVPQWLLADSDPALLYQVNRDLLHLPEPALKPLRDRIGTEGHAFLLMSKRNANGHWGNGVYNPKWTCTHYVLYELLQLGLDPENRECAESAGLLLDQPLGSDGGVNYAKTVEYSDVCINGMLLNIASYFGLRHEKIKKIIDFILRVQMADGAWNCEYLHGAKHGSLHTTISVLEGISRHREYSGRYRLAELADARHRAIEFILRHELFKSETTGETIKDEFFKYYFPVRWKYDILRCLDYFQASGVSYNSRMEPALAILRDGADKNGTWKKYSQPGKTYASLEKAGKGSRWNTLRSVRVLQRYKKEYLPNGFQ